LATLWNAERKIGCELHVVKVTGWRRDQHWPETGLKFVQLSPAMSSFETALLYPGTCLVEGTALSEGRGTEAPFRLIGAPWMDSQRVCADFNRIGLDGVRAHAAQFTPAGRKHAGETCRGVRLEVTDARIVRPVKTGLHLLGAIIRTHRAEFQWLAYPTAANAAGHHHFDRLIGRSDIRQELERQPDDLAAKIEPWTGIDDWPARVARHLLYE
jgi:uncharacterized protein YbbC (DUF1343 family)